MKKRHIAIIPMLGVIGFASLVPSAFAAEPITNHSFAKHLEQCEDHEQCMNKMQKTHKAMGEKNENFRHISQRPLLGEDKEVINAIFESGDFEAFTALITQNAPEDAKSEITQERLDRMEEHFNKMVERFQNGELQHNGEKTQ